MGKPLTTEALVGAYINIRDHISQEKQKFDDAVAELKEQQAKIEQALMDRLKELGEESVKTSAGTAFIARSDYVSVESWDSLLMFIQKEEAWHFLKKDVAKAAVKEYLEENAGELPPGVSYGVEQKVQIRRPRK